MKISYEDVGMQIRFLAGSISFGLWQSSVVAGVFAYFLLITIEPRQQ